MLIAFCILISIWCHAFHLPAVLFNRQWKLILITAENVQHSFATPLIWSHWGPFRSAFGPGPFSIFQIEIVSHNETKRWVWYQTTMIIMNYIGLNGSVNPNVCESTSEQIQVVEAVIYSAIDGNQNYGFTMNYYERGLLHLVCVSVCLCLCIYAFGVFMMFEYRVVQMRLQCSLWNWKFSNNNFIVVDSDFHCMRRW